MTHPEPDWRYVSPLTIPETEPIQVPLPDWRGYWLYEDETGAERDAVPVMIDWLADQSPSVWHAFVRDYTNWDNSTAIGIWIANQKACDRATAARLAFLNEPGYLLRRPGTLDPAHDPLAIVTQNLALGWYQVSEIEDDILDYRGLIDDWRRATEEIASGQQAFTIDESLIGPFSGRIANFPEGQSPVTNPVMWALIERLGVQVTHCEMQVYRDQCTQAKALWQRDVQKFDLLSKLTWGQKALIENGPCLETEEELASYLSGDAGFKEILVGRTKQRLKG